MRRWSSFGSKDVHSCSVNRPPIPIPYRSSKDAPDGGDSYVNSNSRGLQAAGDDDDDDEDGKDFDYDYPDIHGAGIFRSGTSRAHWVKKLQRRLKEGKAVDISSVADILPSTARARLMSLKNESLEVGLRGRTYSNASSDYVPMDSLDDTYINYNSQQWVPSHIQLPPRHGHASVVPRPHDDRDMPPTLRHSGGQYASDDWTVYMNLPMPEKAPNLPTRRDFSTTLPRTKTSVAHNPPTVTHSLSTVTHGPSTGTQGPSMITHGPSTITQGPSMITHAPSTGTQGPPDLPPVAAKPKMRHSLSEETKEPPPVKSTKPQTKLRSATFMTSRGAVSESNSQSSTPKGWSSPPPLPSEKTRILPEEDQRPDYENFDSQPVRMLAQKLEMRRVSDGVLPPRDIPRKPNPN